MKANKTELGISIKDMPTGLSEYLINTPKIIDDKVYYQHTLVYTYRRRLPKYSSSISIEECVEVAKKVLPSIFQNFKIHFKVETKLEKDGHRYLVVASIIEDAPYSSKSKNIWGKIAYLFTKEVFNHVREEAYVLGFLEGRLKYLKNKVRLADK